VITLKRITSPAVEPVTAAEVRLHTRISHTTEDSLIDTWIQAGRELAENFQRRSFVTQVWELTFDEFPCMPLFLPRPPVVSIVSIKYYDSLSAATTLYNSTAPVGTESDFIVDTDSEPGRIDLAYGVTWPAVTLRPMNAVKIRYNTGYGADGTTTPAAVKDAIMLYCGYRYENRTAEVDAVPPHFYNLLTPERVFQ
jgi:uncharacterized phiE125 gp8 family phage protein